MNKMHDSKGKKYNVIIYNPDEFHGDALNNTFCTLIQSQNSNAKF